MKNQQMEIIDTKFKHLEPVSIMLHSRIEDSLKHALYQRQLCRMLNR